MGWDRLTPQALGLNPASGWLETLLWALCGLVVMLAYSPLADRLATRLMKRPPTLGVFRPLQRSWAHLALGLLVAWLLGAGIEEIALRGVLLQWVAGLTTGAPGLAAGLLAAALVAAALHLYQGPRAALIIGQLSWLFGLVFVLSGRNLWAAILCHGLYDTVAFVRFATGRSRYSRDG